MNRFIPFISFAGLVILFAAMMSSERNPKELKSALIDKPIPAFSLPALIADKPIISDSDLPSDTPYIVNFFASWCVPCRAEHDSLINLKQRGIPIIGVSYKDTPQASLRFLNELGDPYMLSISDERGRTGIDFGVTGVPETFIVDANGIIRYRHWGPVVGEAALAKVFAALEKVEQ